MFTKTVFKKESTLASVYYLITSSRYGCFTLAGNIEHSSLDIVQHYAQIADEDLLQAYQAHPPVYNLTRLK